MEMSVEAIILASKLLGYAEEEDPYEYKDTVGNNVEDELDELAESIMANGVDEIEEYLELTLQEKSGDVNETKHMLEEVRKFKERS